MICFLCTPNFLIKLKPLKLLYLLIYLYHIESGAIRSFLEWGRKFGEMSSPTAIIPSAALLILC